MLRERIKEELTISLKKKDEISCSVLRLLLAAFLNREKEKKYKTGEEELTEEEMIGVISSEVKKRKDAVLEFEKGKRQDLAEKEKKEIQILQKYLPEQLSSQEIREMIRAAVKKTNADHIKDMGRVMAELMPQTKGRADSREVSEIVKELLTSKK